LIWSKEKARVLQNYRAGGYEADVARPINLLAQTIKPRQTVSEYSLAVSLARR